MALAEVIALPTVDGTEPIAERDRLLKALAARAADVAVFEAYYDGNHPSPPMPKKMEGVAEARAAFDNLSRLGVTNFCAPIADAPAARLRITGFRFGEVENFLGDDDAWRIWQTNHMDADSGLVHHSAFVTGQAFAMVWPGPDELAQITVEHPSQAIVAYAPGSRRQRAAGLKCWQEDDGSWRAVLYLPTEVWKWQSKPKAHGNGDDDCMPTEWLDWKPNTDDTRPIKNPLGKVPLVEFRANPSLRPAPYGGGRSEFAGGALIIQQRINKTVFDRLVTAEFQAFRQRWAIGWTPDDANQAVRAAVSSLMSFADGPGDVQVGEFTQADFSPFMTAVRSDVEALAALTSTPFYILGQLVNPPSGDALMALQSGLVAKTEDHRDNFSESWEEIFRLALQAQNDDRATDQQSMVLWSSVAHVTFAEKADAAIKYRAVGVPDEAIWTDVLGFTSQDVKRFKVLQADQALFAPQPVVPVGQ